MSIAVVITKVAAEFYRFVILGKQAAKARRPPASDGRRARAHACGWTLDPSRWLHVFIHCTITVIIEAIADLDLGLSAGAAIVADVFVGSAVAVVIKAIADLGRRGATVAAPIENAFIDLSIAVIVLGITNLDGVWTTLSTPIGDTVIYGAIAVVVYRIANFLSWAPTTAVAPLAIDTALQADPALAYIRTAGALLTGRTSTVG